LSVSAVVVSGALIGVSAALLAIGQYRWLDLITKGLIVVLTVTTLLSALLVLSHIQWGQGWIPTPAQLADDKTIIFTAAVVGWMPSAIDIAVWQSLWCVAKRNETDYAPTLRESMLDFHIGYVGTAVFAVCFVLMGAGTMYGTGVELESSAGKFAAQVISMYTRTLGDWSRYLIGPAAFAVLSTVFLAPLPRSSNGSVRARIRCR
jgi:Mn2+/Fe2+ NRAMP family transporter